MGDGGQCSRRDLVKRSEPKAVRWWAATAYSSASSTPLGFSAEPRNTSSSRRSSSQPDLASRSSSPKLPGVSSAAAVALAWLPSAGGAVEASPPLHTASAVGGGVGGGLAATAC